MNLIKKFKYWWYNLNIDDLKNQIDLFYKKSYYFFKYGNREKREYELFTIMETTPIHKLRRLIRQDNFIKYGGIQINGSIAERQELYKLALLKLKLENYRERRLNLLFPHKK